MFRPGERVWVISYVPEWYGWRRHTPVPVFVAAVVADTPPYYEKAPGVTVRYCGINFRHELWTDYGRQVHATREDAERESARIHVFHTYGILYRPHANTWGRLLLVACAQMRKEAIRG